MEPKFIVARRNGTKILALSARIQSFVQIKKNRDVPTVRIPILS